jgi:hypothetical protein
VSACPAACLWERSILPRFPIGACDVAGCGCWLGTCCRAGFLCTRRGVSSGSLSACSASPCSGLCDARLLLTPLFFFLFGAGAGVVRRVPSFGAVVALVTCARLLTPSLPLIPIPTMSVSLGSLEPWCAGQHEVRQDHNPVDAHILHLTWP